MHKVILSENIKFSYKNKESNAERQAAKSKDMVDTATGITSNNSIYDKLNIVNPNLKFCLKDSQVRFGLKHSKNGQTTLYVIVDQNTIELNNFEDIKKDRGHQDASPSNKESSSLRRPININLSQLFNNVNAIDILRYIPDNFLAISQRELKYQVIAETIKYTNYKNYEKYREYISKHDYALAKRSMLVRERKRQY